jgi:glyoxylase-like metal-dependent hydrolase (beta-lactamase superfamily II)
LHDPAARKYALTPVTGVTAANAGPFTYLGTNSYVVGKESVVVIDPGPDDDAHLSALLSAINGRPVSHIFITHTHRDHSPLAGKLKAATGAVTVGEGPHRFVVSGGATSLNGLDASADFDFIPDLAVKDGERIDCGAFAITAITTPGHAENHTAFALEGSGILFSGDHVMGWATTIVAPPDGSMQSYLESLEKLASRTDKLYLPGHGAQIEKPQQRVRALKTHRLQREAAILEKIRQGERTLRRIVETVYASTDRNLHPAAALTAMAHLERLQKLGRISIDGTNGFEAEYTAAPQA